MKEYIAPEIEKVEYDVVDCLTSSSLEKESEDTDTLIGGLF